MGYFDKRGYPWKEFFFAFKKLVCTYKNELIKVNICGSVSRKAKEFINDIGLKSHVNCKGNFLHSDAIKIIRKNNLLLLLSIETQYSRAIVPLKVYHYLGMSKPIFAIAHEDGELAKILETTRTGKAVSVRKKDKIYKTLVEFYEEWKKSGRIIHKPNAKEIEKYNFEKLTKVFSKTINKLKSSNN